MDGFRIEAKESVRIDSNLYMALTIISCTFLLISILRTSTSPSDGSEAWLEKKEMKKDTKFLGFDSISV